MNKSIRFLQTAAIYFLGNILSKLVSFFLLPLYTNYIDPAQYGTYDLVITILNIVYPIAFFQIWDSMFRFAFDYHQEKDKYNVINNAIFVSLFGTIVYSCTAVISSLYYDYDYFWLILFLGLTEAIRYLYSFAARVFLDNKLFVISGAINTVVNAVINIVLIICFHWDIKSLYFAPIIGCLVQILIIEWRLKLIKHFTIKSVSRDLIKQMLKFSIPLCVATISYWLLSGFTKVIVNNYLGSYSNGMYAVANRFASMITLFVSVFQYAWNESAYLMISDTNKAEVFSKCINIFIKMMLYGTGCIICFIYIIFPFFIGERYNDAISIIPTCLVGVAFNSIATFLSTLFMTEKKTNFILTSTLLAALFNIVLSIPFTKWIGLQGTILALDIGFLILLIIRLIRLIKNMDIKIQALQTTICVIVLGITIVIYYSNNIIMNSIFALINGMLVIWATKDYVFPILRKMRDAIMGDK